MLEEKMMNVIYGAGDYGNRWFNFLAEMNVKVDLFCQTEINKKNKECNGVPIISYTELLQVKENMTIFIALYDKELSKKVKRKLLISGKCNMKIYEVGSFIKEQRIAQKIEKERYCNICGTFTDEAGYLPTGLEHSFFKKKHIIGGGKREYAQCPMCGSIDRERWLHYVLSQYTDIYTGSCKVLHFAPEVSISENIKENEKCDYYSGDIQIGRAMHQVDVTNIQFKDEYFDYIIINHVLEHIENEKKAMTELLRVLKKGGKIILSFPICLEQDTYENSEIKTAEERVVYYGQEDHVRLYGKDYLDRLKQYPMSVQEFKVNSLCTEMERERLGFLKGDTILCCLKE